MANSIAICIPSYNCERYVRTTIESALGQTVAADEILISDDRSPDGSFEIIREYESVPRVRILRPPQRTTLGGHYRFLLEQASSDYICFLSSDDALMPNFIETMRRELGGENNVGLITSACIETDSRLRPLKVRGTGTPRKPLDAPAGLRYMAKGCHYTISVSVLARTPLLELPAIPIAGDLATDWCWAQWLGARGRMKFVREPMGFYRIHGTNAGHNRDKEWQEAVLVMLEFLTQHLGPELGAELLPSLHTVQGQIEERRKGLGDGVLHATFRDKLKDAIKAVIAQRYRRLPMQIVKAEQGVGVALRTTPKG